MSAIQIVIMAVTLAAKYEPFIASILGTVIQALEKLHENHDDTVMMADIHAALRQFGIKPANVVAGLERAIAAHPGPEGQTQAQI